MSKTSENLKSAFAGESQANRRYLAFAKKAEAEGKQNLAKLFRAAAAGETIHALNHLNVLGEVKTSEENLKAAVGGETYEIENMYPGFIEEAKGEAEKGAEISFTGAKEVEKVHERLFSEALARIERGEDILAKDYYVCGVCGYLATGEAPDVCPVCGVPKEKFFEIS